jgi:hypothetical protein
MSRQRTLPRTDFQETVGRVQLKAFDDVAGNVFVTKKMLPERFFWRKHARDRVNIQNASPIINETAGPLHFGLICVTFTHVY